MRQYGRPPLATAGLLVKLCYLMLSVRCGDCRLHDNPVFGLACSKLMLVMIYVDYIPVRSPPDSVEDNTAVAILHEYQPATLRLYSPRAIIGDGNCRYRAVSLAMYGDQRHHLHVRLLVAAEMIMHPEHYHVSAANYVGDIDTTIVFTGPYAELLDAEQPMAATQN